MKLSPLFLAVAMISGCTLFKPKTKEKEANSSSVIEPAVKSMTNEIETCWIDSGMSEFEDPAEAGPFNAFTDEEMTAIITIVKEQYTVENAGVAFVGWRSCSELRKEGKELSVVLRKGKPELARSAALTIIKDRSTGKEVGTGMGWGKKVKAEDGTFVKYVPLEPNEIAVANIVFGLDAYCKDARMKLSYSKCVQGLALHEFGHVAGLRHEHIRPEAAEHAGCDLTRGFEDFTGATGTKASIFSERKGESAELVGEYDPRSIMNYCFINTLERKVVPDENGNPIRDENGKLKKFASDDEVKWELSVGDKAALKTLYPVSTPVPATAAP